LVREIREKVRENGNLFRENDLPRLVTTLDALFSAIE
jgi:hypothetical protein